MPFWRRLDSRKISTCLWLDFHRLIFIARWWENAFYKIFSIILAVHAQDGIDPDGRLSGDNLLFVPQFEVLLYPLEVGRVSSGAQTHRGVSLDLFHKKILYFLLFHGGFTIPNNIGNKALSVAVHHSEHRAFVIFRLRS